MVSAEIPGGVYDVLRPKERATLALEAMARGDEAEVHRIVRTCPKRTYLMSDAAYGERMDQLLTFSLVVCADLRAVSARLRQLDALRHVLPVLLEANVDTATGAFFAGVHYDRARHGAAGPEADPEAPEDPELSRLLDETEREADRLALRVGRLLDALTADAAADFLSMWEAWGRFSRQRAGVGPMDLLRAFEMPCCPEFAGVLERHEDAAPDPARTTFFAGLLFEGWANHFEDEPAPQ